MLPEKWCIKLTPENQAVVGEYFDRQIAVKGPCYTDSRFANGYLVSHDAANNYIMDGKCGANVARSVRPIDYIEISFEDFKTWVLRLKEEVIYEIY